MYCRNHATESKAQISSRRQWHIKYLMILKYFIQLFAEKYFIINESSLILNELSTTCCETYPYT